MFEDGEGVFDPTAAYSKASASDSQDNLEESISSSMGRKAG